MKVKLKLDAASIKKWLIEHGEKLAFSVMVIIFLAFTVSAARGEALDATKQPEKLQATADDVKMHVVTSKWDDKREGVQVVDYGQRTKRDQVVPAPFALLQPFNPVLVEPKVKREDPVLFAVEEPQAAAGFGSFALHGDGESIAPTGAPPVRVAPAQPTPPPGGRLAGSGMPGRSTLGGGIAVPPPRLGGGAPPTVSGPSAGPGTRPSKDAKLAPRAWAVVTALVPYEKQASEYSRVFERAMGGVPERDVPRYLGYKLERTEVSDADPKKEDWKRVPDPTLFEKEWDGGGAEIVVPEYTDPAVTSPLGPLVQEWSDSVAHPKIPLASAGNAPPQVAPPVAEEPEKPAEPEKDAAKPPAEDDGFTNRRQAPQPIAPTPDRATSPTGPATIKYRLLRGFDYSVEPNKRYRYRVKLGLTNPNARIAERYLKNPEAPRPEIRETVWSAPTDVVTIPDGFGVLAAGIKPPKSGEPLKAKLLLTAIDKQNGIETAFEQDFERGAVANAANKTVNAVDPRNQQPREIEHVDFTTGMVVLDISGGKAISKKKDLFRPAEILMMDANGNLSVRNEFDDHAAYLKHKPPDSEERTSDKPDKASDTKPVKRTLGGK